MMKGKPQIKYRPFMRHFQIKINLRLEKYPNQDEYSYTIKSLNKISNHYVYFYIMYLTFKLHLLPDSFILINSVYLFPCLIFYSFSFHSRMENHTEIPVYNYIYDQNNLTWGKYMKLVQNGLQSPLHRNIW